MCLIWSSSISNFKDAAAGPSVPPLIEATRPTGTPRNLTFALESITRPDRSAVKVTGTYDFSLPVNNAYVSKREPIRSTNRASVHHPAWSPSPFLASATVLPSQIEVAGLPVHGKRDHHHHERRDDQRATHRAPDSLPHSGRPTARGEAVIGMYQHDRHRHGDALNERPKQVGGVQERSEVMVVDPCRLTIENRRAQTRGPERCQHADAVQGDHHDQAGDHPGGGEEGDAPDPHHLERVDFIVDPHGAELCGSACTDGGGQCDSGGRRRDQPDVEERRRKSG